MEKNNLSITQKKVNKLLIIGNGFDLQCNLHSKFSHFIDYLFKKEDSYDYKAIRKNIWYILIYYKYYLKSDFLNESLKYNDDIQWMDFELFIKEVITNKYEKVKEVFDELDSNYFGKENKKKNINVGPIIENTVSGLHQEVKKCVCKSNNSSLFSNCIDFLFDSLSKFEKDFCDFLNPQVTDEYKEKAKALKDKVDKKVPGIGKIFIISFNYTNPFYDNNLELLNDDTLLVHGSLSKNNIIIGIDCGDINYDESIKGKYRFSKGWRKIRNYESAIQIPPSSIIEEIVFYGHSLGDQDYSYFYSLFNYYDIYNGKIKLIFLFSNYESSKKKNEFNKNAYIDKIFTLLRHYVTDSLGIKEANSFITKIQLENRLLIQEI